MSAESVGAVISAVKGLCLRLFCWYDEEAEEHRGRLDGVAFVLRILIRLCPLIAVGIYMRLNLF